jgi:hypothetical protein
MLPGIQTVRDFREFIAAKKRKREPLRWHGRGSGSASYRPSSAHGFANFRAALRGVGDWGQASERVDALEDALRRRNAVGLPLPHKVIQNADRSLSFFWEGAMVRCFPDGFVSLIGGVDGVKAKTATRELLDLLAFQSRIQAVA